MKFDHDAFFKSYTAKFGSLDDKQQAGLGELLTAIESDTDVSDVRWIAYMLATVKHECANTWHAIEEYGKGRGRPYGNAVVVTGADGKQYSNVYYGRGYVQLTWDHNYKKMSQALNMGDDLYIHPELALDSGIAYRIMSYGMRNGSFTGKSLGTYINGSGCDYSEARRIINRLDQAGKIKGYAVGFEAILKEAAVSPAPDTAAANTQAVSDASGSAGSTGS